MRTTLGHGFQPSTLGGISKTTIVTLYPLIFWVLVLKLIGIGGIIPSTILADPALNAALTTYFYIGLAHLAIGILILVWQTLAFLRPVQLLRTSIPRMVSNVRDYASIDADSALRIQVKDLLISSLTRGQLKSLALYSRLKQSIPLQLILFATFPGRIIVTIELARFLSPLAMSWISLGPRDISSSFILVGLLSVLSAINFNHLLTIEKSSHYQKVRPRYYMSRRILSEFTIFARVPTIFEAIAKYRFGVIEVESPNENTLSDIIKRVLSAQVGSPLIFFYKFEELYPLSELKHVAKLAPVARDFLMEAHPVAFVAIFNGECILFAEVDMLDVRRMDVWSRSPALTRKIVAKSEKLLMEN